MLQLLAWCSAPVEVVLSLSLSGVADQLQTNFASDLRNILKQVFDMQSSEMESPKINKSWDSQLSSVQCE